MVKKADKILKKLLTNLNEAGNKIIDNYSNEEIDLALEEMFNEGVRLNYITMNITDDEEYDDEEDDDNEFY